MDAGLLLALCLRSRLGDDKCEIVLFSSAAKDREGFKSMCGLGPKVLSNIRRCKIEASRLGGGTDLPIPYLQRLSAAREKLDHLIVFTDGLISPAKDPANALGRWLYSYRRNVQPIKYACVDLLGLGKPSIGEGTNVDDTFISGFSEASLRYLTQEPGAQVLEVENIDLPPPKQRSKK